MIARTHARWVALTAILATAACRDASGPEAVLRTGTFAAAKGGKGGPDRTAPSAPASLRATAITSSSVSLAWDASSDNVGVAAYRVLTGFGGEMTVPGTQTSLTWTGLTALQTYTFYAYAVDAAGNSSSVSNFVSVKLPAPTAPDDPTDVTPPSAPTNVLANSYNDGSREMQITWSASTDNVTPQLAIIYHVYVNGVLDNSSQGITQASVYGVLGDNVITVIAVDANGNRSAAGSTTVNIPF